MIRQTQHEMELNFESAIESIEDNFIDLQDYGITQTIEDIKNTPLSVIHKNMPLVHQEDLMNFDREIFSTDSAISIIQTVLTGTTC